MCIKLVPKGSVIQSLWDYHHSITFILLYNIFMNALDPPYRLTDGPTVGPLVGQTVGDLGGGELHTESCK